MTEQQILQQQEASADASPAKSLGTDLRGLRQALRDTGRAYLRRLETDLEEVMLWADSRAKTPKLHKSEIRDLADMVTLVRQVDVKAAKGRRKDLKKIDTTITELREVLGQARDR